MPAEDKNLKESEILRIVYEFESGTNSRSAWRHAEHLTVALFYIFNHDFETTYRKMRDGLFNLLRGFEVDLSVKMPYHKTLMFFWLRTIRDFAGPSAGNSLVAV